MTEAASYDTDQAKLRQDYDGGGSDGDFEVPLPQIPEVNPEIFKDVEPMLFRGFLVQPVEINGVQFLLKSLNHHEFEMVNLLSNGEGFVATQRFYDLFLSYGVLMVDGVNVMPDRDQWTVEIQKMFEGLVRGAKDKIVRHMSEMNRRATRAVVLTEAYFLENSSRLRWAQLRGLDLTSTSATGISGTERLGMNWAQLAWRSLNYFEDTREQSEADWENAKFVASSMAGKGMSKIHAQDRQRKKTLQDERIDRRDKILRLAILGKDDGVNIKDGQVIRVARSTEELATQLQRDLKGEKDWHDMVVEAHETRAKQEIQDRSTRMQEYAEKHALESGGRSLYGGTADITTGLSNEEVQERMQRRRAEAARRLEAPKNYPDLTDPKTARFIEKWSAAGDEGGVKVIKTNRDPSTALPIPAGRGGTPFNRGN